MKKNIFPFYLHFDDQININIRSFQEQQIPKDVLHLNCLLIFFPIQNLYFKHYTSPHV